MVKVRCKGRKTVTNGASIGVFDQYDAVGKESRFPSIGLYCVYCLKPSYGPLTIPFMASFEKHWRTSIIKDSRQRVEETTNENLDRARTQGAIC